METRLTEAGAAVASIIAGACVASAADRAGRLFDRIDAGGDGRSTGAEADGARDTIFERMEAGGDGQVSPAEMASGPGSHRAEQVERRFRRSDGNADSSVSLDEKTGAAGTRGAAKRFERLDVNGDGALARAEFDAAAAGQYDRFDADGDGAVTRAMIQGAVRRGG